MEEEEAFVKLIIVGDQGVGKTSMLNKYCYNKFENNQAPTIGCDFTMKVTQYDNQIVRLQLWDVAGQERYKSVSKLYVRGALGCLVVGDIKDYESLGECLKWQKIVNEHCNQINGQNIPVLLIQNKVDETKNMGKLEEFQTIEFLEKFAEENGFFKCYQTSAKDGTNIEECFNTMLKKIIDSGVLQEKKNEGNFNRPTQTPANNNNNKQNNVTLNNQKQGSSGKKEGGCC